jgi:hypothetical protein
MPPKKGKGDGDAMSRVEAKLDLFKEHFDHHMTSVNVKLDKCDERLDKVDITLAKQQVILDEHVKRTNLLEEKVDADRKETAAALEPLKVQGSQIKLMLKIGGAILGAGAGGFGIKELIAFFAG